MKEILQSPTRSSDSPAHGKSLAIGHVIASINSGIGGPAISVPSLAQKQASLDMDVSICSLNYTRHGTSLETPGVTRSCLEANWLAQHLRGYSPEFLRQLKYWANSWNIVHNHGLWMFPNYYARVAAKGKVLVSSPRGMLESWSLGRNRLQKLIVLRLFERRNLKAVNLFHATSEEEYLSIRRFGLDQPVVIAPNGMDLPNLDNIPARRFLEDRWPQLAGKRWCLFLSRIHPKKGIEELLSAWRQIAVSKEDWILAIAGDGEESFKKRLQEITSVAPLSGRCLWLGEVSGETKASLLKHSSVFCLPTHSENFGLAIAESLAHATPVITTHAAPWQKLLETHSGWWIQLGIAELKASLNDALGRTDAELDKMGLRGRELIRDSFDWTVSATRLLHAYQWMLKRDEKPDCVHLD